MQIKPDTKVIVISALKDPATGIQAIKKGARGFLSKPFSQEEIIEEMKACLDDSE
jgi:two-component system chemotaxis response regulator CheY